MVKPGRAGEGAAVPLTRSSPGGDYFDRVQMSRLNLVASRQIFGASYRDAAVEDLAISPRCSATGGRAKGIGNIVIDPNVNRLFFILAAAFFALAVVRTLGLLFS
jgi:hypothetical protein